MSKKYIWSDENGLIEFDDAEMKSLVKFKVGKVYFEILRNTETGQLINGWVSEDGFDEIFGEAMKYKREDFIQITDEEIINLINNR